jgi:predicted ATPase
MYLLRVRIQSERFPTRRCYPFNIPTISETQELVFRRPVVLFLGENGSGKSTVLDAIARRCSIHIWDKPRRHRAHNNPFETRLQDYVATTWANGMVPGSIFRAETFRDLADFLDDVALCDPGRLQYLGGHILNTLSHGEGILNYFRGRFQTKGLYLLDEPEAALSPANQIRFLDLLQKLETEGQTQFIIATHSPILLGYPQAQVFIFDGTCIREVAYQDTEHYQTYKRFFTDPSAFFNVSRKEDRVLASAPAEI